MKFSTITSSTLLVLFLTSLIAPTTTADGDTTKVVFTGIITAFFCGVCAAAAVCTQIDECRRTLVEERDDCLNDEYDLYLWVDGHITLLAIPTTDSHDIVCDWNLVIRTISTTTSRAKIVGTSHTITQQLQ